MRFPQIALVAALLLSPAAFAEEGLQLDLANKPFEPQKTAVLQTINTDEKYSEITSDKRSEVTQALERISGLLSEEASFKTVDGEVQKQILADQQMINEALDQAKRDSRMVCAKEPVVGSNLPKKVCKTAAARNRDNTKVRAKNGTDIKI